jgi:hypothetical protein
MKKIFGIMILIGCISARAEVEFITVAQDPSVSITVVSADGIRPYLIETGTPNIKRVIKTFRFTKFLKDQIVISHTEYACAEGLERSLWARDGSTNELLSAIQPWTKVSGKASLKIYDMVCIKG